MPFWANSWSRSIAIVRMQMRHKNTHKHMKMHNNYTSGSRRPRATRLCRIGALGRCFRPNHASMPTVATRTCGTGKIARATGNQTRAGVICMPRVHSSSAGPGRRDLASRSARMQCQTDASPFGHVMGLHVVEKRAHHTISSTRSRQMHAADELWSGAGRGTRNAGARGMLAAACLTRACVATVGLRLTSSVYHIFAMDRWRLPQTPSSSRRHRRRGRDWTGGTVRAKDMCSF